MIHRHWGEYCVHFSGRKLQDLNQFDVKVFNKETDMVMICRVTLCILLKTGQNICTDVAVFSLIVTVSSVN